MIWRAGFISLVLLLLSVWHWTVTEPGPTRRVLLNANVLTMDADNSQHQAVAIAFGKIQAVGSNAQIRQLIRPDSIVTDLHGATLLPGFIDPHSHFPVTGLRAVTVDIAPPPISDTDTIDKLLKQLRQQLPTSASDNWLIGFGYDDSSLAERRHPKRAELDSVSSEIPIYLWHSSGHMGVANSRALELLNIDAWTEPPDGGVIERDPQTGQLTGLLQETAAPSMARLLRDLQPTDYWRIMRHAITEYAASGITTAQSGGINLQMIRALKLASSSRLLPFRLNVWGKHQQIGDALIDGSLNPARYNNNRFNLGPVKLFADGSPQGRTAYLTQPFYRNPPNMPNNRAFPAYSQTDLNALVQRYYDAGLQMAIHGNGDAAIDYILNAFEAARPTDHDDSRLIVVHAQMTRQDQLVKMKQLGITPSFFSNHTYFWGDAHSDFHMGPERAGNMSPAASAAALALPFSIHTDAPVTPINPLQLVWSAVQRRSASGRSIGPHQRISVTQALRAITIDAAWQVFQEDSRGSIEPGKLADFVVLSDDPRNDPENLRELLVLETIVGGKTIFQQPSAAGFSR